jgi:D-sedoheptulose 7-phosphate isomerase
MDFYFSKLEQIIKDIDRKSIETAIQILFKAWQKGKTVYAIGCGGSASTATHFVCDISKVTIIPGKKRLKAISLVDNIPLVSAWTNDSGWGSVFKEQLETWMQKDDVLVAFSVHGGSGDGDAGPWSQNLVQAMDFAKKCGAKIIGLSGFDGGAMGKMSDASIIVPATEEPMATPIIEGFHCVLAHLLAISLMQKIKNAKE